MIQVKIGALAIGHKRGSLPEGTGLAFQPRLPTVRRAFSAAAAFKLGRVAKPFGNVGVVNEGAATLGILLPTVGAVKHSFGEQEVVAQVKRRVLGIERLDKLGCVGVHAAAPCGAAGGDRGEGGG